MDRNLSNYIDELKSDVSSLVYSDGEGALYEDKFTEYCIEFLESIGKCEGARVLSYIHPTKDGRIDWKINGYGLRDAVKTSGNKIHYETLDLFITYYKNDRYDYNITKADFEKSLNQIKKFLNAALKRHIDYLDPSHSELIELVKLLGTNQKDFDRINVYLLINGFSNHTKEKFEVLDVNVYVQVWDINRFFRIHETNSVHEPIEINFKDFLKNQNGLQCLKIPTIDELYDCYLAVIPGEVLADLYKEYSSELLESNVRAFLGQAGKFNKGIRDTIRQKPQMFLPYNNGITATANSVETVIKDNNLYLTKLDDFQIVNGGQTTASLYHTRKKFKDADLNKIFVQMKLTVIKDRVIKDEEVPNIARFANSQNKVSELDLSSNNPFFIQIENISRKKYVTNPDNKQHSFLWFFERVTGQYRESLNKKTKAQQRVFKEQNPLNRKFVKSDISKFINLWDQQPYYVSQGSQKNFVQFIKKISDKKLHPGDNFYKKLIANAILFKSTDKLFGRKNVNAIGDTNLKSYTVAYTLSFFHYLTDNRIDLWKIYEEQQLDEDLESEIKALLIFVFNHLIEEAGDSLISEYAKRAKSWDTLKSTLYNKNLIGLFPHYFISDSEKEIREKEKDKGDTKGDDRLFIISKVHEFGNKFWDGMKFYIKETPIQGVTNDAIESLIKKLTKNNNLTIREVNLGKRAISLLEDKPYLLETIKSRSSLKETLNDSESIKIKFDKLSLIDKDNWSKYIALGVQTNTFTNIEAANVKSISSSIIKKEVIKEQALIKAYESLKKLGKFGVKV